MSCNRYMMLNGELTQEEFSDTPYIYCNILTLGRKAYFVEEHLKTLSVAALELFNSQIEITHPKVREQIGTLLEANRASHNNNIKVELRFDAVGDIYLYSHEATIYSGYTMRHLHPEACIIPSEMPLPLYPTSAGVATYLMADAMAHARGYGIAIVVERNGSITEEPTSPIFTIRQGVLTALTGSRSVEKALVEKAALAIGLKISHQYLTAQELLDAEEIIISNWQGITALSQIASRPLMDITAKKLANILATYVK